MVDDEKPQSLLDDDGIDECTLLQGISNIPQDGRVSLRGRRTLGDGRDLLHFHKCQKYNAR